MKTTRTILVATLLAVSGLATAQDGRPATAAATFPESSAQTMQDKPAPTQTVLQSVNSAPKAAAKAENTNSVAARSLAKRAPNNAERLNALFFTNP